MKHWIYKLKVWLIHKLGGYTRDEATHNRKVKSLAVWHRYTTDMLRMSQSDIHAREKQLAMKKLLAVVESYVSVSERRDYETGEWILRLSMRVVDEHLL